MKSKKKLIIALSSFAFVLVAAVVTVTAVLAAATQNVESNVNIVYTAKQVKGSVSATYAYSGVKTESGEIDTVTFDGAEASTKKAVDPKETFTLTASDGATAAVVSDVLTFTFTFTNGGDAAYTATFAYTPDETPDVNMVLTPCEPVTVPAGAGVKDGVDAVTATITVKLADVALNGAFSGTFGWTLVA